MMQSLKERLGTSVVMITMTSRCCDCCDYVAVIYAGEIVEYGTAEHIFDYTAHPYTIGLFNSLPKLDTKERWLNPIKGLMPDPTNLPSGCKFRERCPNATDQCGKKPPDIVEIAPGHFVKCIFAGR
jgi:peptide/nickel transport system ATP-binding protein